MEYVRADATLDTITLHYQRLKNYLERAEIPPEFVFNVDESGFQEFVDAVTTPIVVPIEYQGEKSCLRS